MCAGDNYKPGTSGGSASAVLKTENLPAHARKGYYVTDLASGTEKAGYRTSASSASISSEVFTTSDGVHTHTVTTTANTSGIASGNTTNSSALTSGTASGNTADSSVLTSGQASGNTANTGSGTAFSILPPYKTVYAWECTN